MATSAEQERRRFSYKDYCKWTDDGRWELIDGVEYDMSPAPSRIHQKLSGELFDVLTEPASSKHSFR